MNAPVAAISPGSDRVRVTVERIDKPRGATRVGDWFEVHGSRLILPPGQGFCPYALAAVFPVVVMRQADLPADSWLVRKPWICGPDAEENLVMRVEAVYESADAGASS
ncbi:TIGR04076 family protein [Microbacterium sp.]|uniref:TIGR04076 family protein n=1 Tax=Microbacterium sp. TaxID=51671 RepID=UPI0025F1FA63|nr:TIGR04076 family protein [Microbacterium sp.]